VTEHCYWEIDFPDRGQEERGPGEKRLVDGFEEVLLRATERRLRADVPVVSYLSGGVDSTTVVALASHIRQKPIPTFTIRIDDPGLDETSEASIAARHVGTQPIVVNCGAAEILNTFPRLIRAADAPVIDTSCAALLLLAQEVHARGYKVALTGEGADEWLAGYPWYKIDKILSYLDVIPGLRLSQVARRGFLRLTGAPRFPREFIGKVHAAVGGHNAWLDLYGMVSLAKLRFFSPWLQEQLADHIAYADLGINLDRLRRWHPLNRALYFGIRVHLPGLLLNAKGDRVAMHSSVETRYPYLDENVFAYLAPLHPRWKMHGFKEKYLLRRLAERWLPASIAWRRKAMFRAPFDSFFSNDPAQVPAFVDQLLSPESLQRTGYFDAAAVQHWRQAFRSMGAGSKQRVFLEMGLVGVVATQLWHHTYLDGGLADLPSQKVEPAVV
jgi:asparagine synthase (glutamine-hydrolysing)